MLNNTVHSISVEACTHVTYSMICLNIINHTCYTLYRKKHAQQVATVPVHTYTLYVHTYTLHVHTYSINEYTIYGMDPIYIHRPVGMPLLHSMS